MWRNQYKNRDRHKSNANIMKKMLRARYIKHKDKYKKRKNQQKKEVSSNCMLKKSNTVIVIVCTTMARPANFLMGSPMHRGQLPDIQRKGSAFCPACHFPEILY